MRRLIIVFLLVLLFAHLHPLRVHAADNMCNVNPGSCNTPEQWVTGWYQARQPENINAVPQQPEYTQRNEGNDGNAAPDRPVEIIRLAGEPNSVNRSDIAADDAKSRGGDPINDKRTHDKINLDKNLQPISNNGGSTGFTQSGIWGKYGKDCDRNAGSCTGTTIRLYSCSADQIVKTNTGKNSSGAICLQNLQTVSGTIDCVAEANKRCAFVQLDVVTSDPFAASAITCYPTNCAAAPAGNNNAPVTNNQPQQPSSGETAQDEAPPSGDNPPAQDESPTNTPTPTATPTEAPVPGGVCEAIIVYDANNNDITAVIKNGSRKLTAGETIVLATPKGQATKARFRIQGIADWTENDTTKTTDTQYRLSFQIPSTMTQAQGTFEVEVFVNNQWK